MQNGQAISGRYILERFLHDVGDAARWVAHDDTLQRRVELWIQPAESDTAQAVHDAARRAAVVEDARLPRILDIGGEDGIAWVVQQHDPSSQTLSEIVGAGPVRPDEARRLTGEAATALEAARRHGVHHGALTPDLVARAEDGSVMVSGLAIAAALGHAEDFGAERASRIDTRDLLGLLHTALTGGWPIDRPSSVPQAPRERGRLLPPTQIVAEVPEDLRALDRGIERLPGSVPSVNGLAVETPGDLARMLSPWSAAVVPGHGVYLPGVAPADWAPSRAIKNPDPAGGQDEDAANGDGTGDASDDAAGDASGDATGGVTAVAVGGLGTAVAAGGLSAGSEALSGDATEPIATTPRLNGPAGSDASSHRAAPAGSAPAGGPAGSAATGGPAGSAAAEDAAGASEAAGPRASGESDDTVNAGGTPAIASTTTGTQAEDDASPGRGNSKGLLVVGASLLVLAGIGATALALGGGDGESPNSTEPPPAAAGPQSDDNTTQDQAQESSSDPQADSETSDAETSDSETSDAETSSDPSDDSQAAEESIQSEAEPTQSASPSESEPEQPSTDPEASPSEPVQPTATPDSQTGESGYPQPSASGVAPDSSSTQTEPSSAPSTTTESGDNPSATGGARAPASGWPITSIVGYDPYNDGDEHTDWVGRINDGDPTTHWRTHRYNSPPFGGFTDALGLRLDLGQERTVREVELGMPEGSWSYQVHVGTESDIASAEQVGGGTGGGRAAYTLEDPRQARYVFIWFTETSPATGGGWYAAMDTITIR